MKILKGINRNLLYIPVILFLSVSLSGCFVDDEKDQEARHVPGVYTGTFNGSPMTIAVGEDAVTRLVITVESTSIDITGSWPLTWNNDDYGYNFVITTTAGVSEVIINGIAGIDVDDIPTVQGSVQVDGVNEGAFYLYL